MRTTCVKILLADSELSASAAHPYQDSAAEAAHSVPASALPISETSVLHVPMTREAARGQRVVPQSGRVEISILGGGAELPERLQKRLALLQILRALEGGPCGRCGRPLQRRALAVQQRKLLVSIASRIFCECPSFSRMTRPVAGVWPNTTAPERATSTISRLKVFIVRAPGWRTVLPFSASRRQCDCGDPRTA